MNPKNASARPSTRLTVDRSTSGYKGKAPSTSGTKSGFGAGATREATRGMAGEPQPSDSNATPQRYQLGTDGIE